MKLAVIGQGVVGRAVADNLESRGFIVVRYSLEKEYAKNKKAVKDCSIVIVCVPTPTKRGKQDISAVLESLSLLGARNKSVVIKSTILPGTTEMLQKKFRKLLIIHSPEFLSTATAAKDAATPFMNVIGIPRSRFAKERYGQKIKRVISTLPKTPLLLCTATEAEIVKYAHNIHWYVQVVFWNSMYDYATAHRGDWRVIKQALDTDPLIPARYASPIHKNGRGAGGGCFVKDYAAFLSSFIKTKGVGENAIEIMRAI